MLAMKTMADAARNMMTALCYIVAMVARVAATLSSTQIIITVLDIQAGESTGSAILPHHRRGHMKMIEIGRR